MPSRNAEQQPPSGSEPRIDGLSPAALPYDSHSEGWTRELAELLEYVDGA